MRRSMHPKQQRRPDQGRRSDDTNNLKNGVPYLAVRVSSCKMSSAGAIPSFNRNGHAQHTSRPA